MTLSDVVTGAVGSVAVPLPVGISMLPTKDATLLAKDSIRLVDALEVSLTTPVGARRIPELLELVIRGSSVAMISEAVAVPMVELVARPVPETSAGAVEFATSAAEVELVRIEGRTMIGGSQPVEALPSVAVSVLAVSTVVALAVEVGSTVVVGGVRTCKELDELGLVVLEMTPDETVGKALDEVKEPDASVDAADELATSVAEAEERATSVAEMAALVVLATEPSAVVLSVAEAEELALPKPGFKKLRISTTELDELAEMAELVVLAIEPGEVRLPVTEAEELALSVAGLDELAVAVTELDELTASVVEAKELVTLAPELGKMVLSLAEVETEAEAEESTLSVAVTGELVLLSVVESRLVPGVDSGDVVAPEEVPSVIESDKLLSVVEPELIPVGNPSRSVELLSVAELERPVVPWLVESEEPAVLSVELTKSVSTAGAEGAAVPAVDKSTVVGWEGET